jgi:hypothetical protein
MQIDFEPYKLKKANSVLQRHLNAVKGDKEKNEVHQEEVLKPSLWHKIKHFFKKDQ